MWGSGSRGIYKGAKLTKKTWEAITDGGGLAAVFTTPRF
jgi:hypothetical protein